MIALLATPALVAVLGALSIIDVRTRRLPDALTLPLIGLGLTFTSALAPERLGLHAVAAVLGYSALWAISVVYRRSRGYDGLGLGDAKLLAAAGAWLGPFALAPLVLIAALSAIATIGALRVAGRPASMQSSLPLGPYLSGAFLLLWCSRGAY